MLHLWSTLAIVVIGIGVLQRQKRRLHRALMWTAFSIDLGLVLYIEATRQAVEHVVGGVSPLVMFHAVVSTLVLVAYAAQFAIGSKVFAGVEARRRTHFVVGTGFVVLRSLNYVTSYFV